jgi:hypothetical protein
MQAMILWAVGKPCFGIEPTTKLKSLLIQAENDDAELAEFRDGVCEGLKLNPEERALAGQNVKVVTECSRTSNIFFREVVEPLLKEYGPDLIWIDPALAYLGGDVNSQKDVGTFLRTYLNPLLHQYNCAAVVIHHSNKPAKGNNNREWQGGEFAYLGSGSSEWANWARAILVIRQTGRSGVFELRAPKRGGRLGWLTPEGKATELKAIAHANEKRIIYWREADPEELPKVGRSKSYDPDELVGLLTTDGLPTGGWLGRAKEELGMSGSTFHRARRELKEQGRIAQSGGTWKIIPTKP